MKNTYRQQYKTIRENMSSLQVQQYSERIATRLFATPFWQTSRVIMLYLSFRNEVLTDAIFRRGWNMGKTMLVPICSPENGHMEFSRITSMQHLVLNRYGIRELPESRVQIVPPEQIDLCLIPGIAFDMQGNRLGFGAGYYDRYLPMVDKRAARVALAYECQLHPDTLPTDKYDLPVQYILTEKQLYAI